MLGRAHLPGETIGGSGGDLGCLGRDSLCGCALQRGVCALEVGELSQRETQESVIPSVDVSVTVSDFSRCLYISVVRQRKKDRVKTIPVQKLFLEFCPFVLLVFGH